MGMFSVRGPLPQQAERASPVRIHSEVLRRLGAVRARLALAAGAVLRTTGLEVAARLGKARLAAIAATNDARIVAILLLLAAVALGLEMAASFHVI
ncbi:MAG TPA: hypothetical protein VHK65_02305 [Candidatus Dormibacteraeota bacterium]|nr:hypothetical protein [Candidatus Dormibacteraeota bacterium]